MTVEQLASVAGVVLSLLLAYVPGLATWYANKDAMSKARIMGGLLILVALSIFGMACAHIISDFGLAVMCTKESALQLVQILIAALIANQGTFMLAVRPFKR